MKKTLVSLAAIAALTTGAMAADKGIDLIVTGQAVVYYETNTLDTTGDEGLFHKDNSTANVGVQLNVGGDLGNNFTLGTQLSYLGTLGIEQNLVNAARTDTAQSTNGALNSQIMLSKIFVAKQIGNTTAKLGRQELPKSLSPFAFSEGWNVYKNTFDAALFINTDLPDTTVVAAWVGKANDVVGTYGTMNDLDAVTSLGAVSIESGAYLLTVSNKSLPMTTLTGSYYSLQELALGATDLGQAGVAWLDVKVAGKDMPLGLSVGLQGGSIMLDSGNAALTANNAEDTTGFGVKVGLKPIDSLYVQLAYTSVDDGTVAMKNVGGGVKTPFYTQAILNQNFIARDSSTVGIKAVYNTGDYGKIIANLNITSDDRASLVAEDYSELDLIYKVKSDGVTYWASAMFRTMDRVSGSTAWESDNRIRLWARKAF